MNRIRIENTTGIGYQTRVTNAETGELIPGVVKVEVNIPVDGPVECTLYLSGVQVDIVTEDRPPEVVMIAPIDTIKERGLIVPEDSV